MSEGRNRIAELEAQLDDLKRQAPPQSQGKVFIALPCYTGGLAVMTYKSLMHDLFQIVQGGTEVSICDEIGHADIYLLRAQMMRQFLDDKDATDMVMIDNDVGWEPGGLLKLLRHDVDVVAGVYPKRENPIKFMFRCALNHGEDVLPGDPTTGLVEVWGAPAGFMRITRTAAEQMVGAYSDLIARDEGFGNVCRVFDPYWVREDGETPRVLSEDYSFCQRWRDIGGKVFIDVSIGMSHIGPKAFMGRLGEFVAREPIGETT